MAEEICTCELEPSFLRSRGMDPTDSGLVIVDAEGEVVCEAKSEKFAELICWALNRSCDKNHACCIQHGNPE